MRVLFDFLFLLSLHFVFLIGYVSFDVVPLLNLSDRFMYSSRQTLYLETVWCTSKITKKYVDMQTTQSFYFLEPTHIVHR